MISESTSSDSKQLWHSGSRPRVPAFPVVFGSGFYPEEQGGGGSFRWMAGRGVLHFEAAPGDRFLELCVLSEFHDLSQRLRVSASDSIEEFRLPNGYGSLSARVPGGSESVCLEVNKLFPAELHPGDTRGLSVRIRTARIHDDPVRHGFQRRQHENLVLNLEEMRAGSVSLRSTPPSLGIDLHGACNVKPPCVFCEWEYSKALEGDRVNAPFSRETLRRWGPFFDNAANLVNCSIGEPFMMRNLEELLDLFGAAGKVLEMTSNGQILTDSHIRVLVHRPVDLYISIDAATALTYKRLRNDAFDRVLGNIRRLVTAKGGRGGQPRIHLVFMPMRCNVHELEDFVRLCADLQVDRLVLRPLNYSDSIELAWERAGYRFEYTRELLPFPEIVQVSSRAARWCAEHGVTLADQMDFGGALREEFPDGGEQPSNLTSLPQAPNSGDLEGKVAAPQAAPRNQLDEGIAKDSTATGPPASDGEFNIPSLTADRSQETVSTADHATAAVTEHQGGQPVQKSASLGDLQGRPLCEEPWKSLYILRRGVLPCCYGGKPIASADDFREAWNGPLLQAIRRDLVAGRFHDYCLRSPACPVVRKADHSARLPFRQRSLIRVRRAWQRLNRVTANVPSRWFGFARRQAARVLRRVCSR